MQGINTPLTRVMLARPPLGDRNGRDGGYMQTQGRPPDAQKAITIPTIEEAMRTISELRTELAAATNQFRKVQSNPAGQLGEA